MRRVFGKHKAYGKRVKIGPKRSVTVATHRWMGQDTFLLSFGKAGKKTGLRLTVEATIAMVDLITQLRGERERDRAKDLSNMVYRLVVEKALASAEWQPYEESNDD